MTVNFANAIAAYREAATRALNGPDAAAVAEPKGPGFSDLVKNALGDAVEAGRKSEGVALQAVANQADLNEVVTAVTNAEVTLQTVVAIRDRVIQAYQEIMRMPI